MRDAGAEPRYLLRYQFTAGRTERCELDLQITAKIAISGGLQMPESPTLRASIEATVDDVAADGSARISTRVTAARILDDGTPEPRARAYFTRTAAALVGTRTTRRVSTRGEISEASAAAPSAMTASTADPGWQVDRTFVALPAEPVGAGARWDATYERAFRGANMTFSEHAHVLDAHEADAQVETDFTTTAPVQLLDRDVVLRKVSGEGHTVAAWASTSLCAAGDAAAAFNFVVDNRTQRAGFRLEIRSAMRRAP